MAILGVYADGWGEEAGVAEGVYAGVSEARGGGWCIEAGVGGEGGCGI